MKQATQLPIPFEDLDPVTRPEPSQVPGAADTHFLYFEGAELRALNALAAAVAKGATKADTTLAFFAQAALFISFGFALVFIAVIIGG